MLFSVTCNETLMTPAGEPRRRKIDGTEIQFGIGQRRWSNLSDRNSAAVAAVGRYSCRLVASSAETEVTAEMARRRIGL